MILSGINYILINDCITVNDGEWIDVHILCYPFIVFRSSKYTKVRPWSTGNRQCWTFIFSTILTL